VGGLSVRVKKSEWARESGGPSERSSDGERRDSVKKQRRSANEQGDSLRGGAPENTFTLECTDTVTEIRCPVPHETTGKNSTKKRRGLHVGKRRRVRKRPGTSRKRGGARPAVYETGS